VLISDNSTDFTGGGVDNGNRLGSVRLTITNSVVRDNTATWHGGGVFNGDALVVAGSTIVNNEAGHEGGGIGMFSGQLELEASLIAGNRALNGGGIFTNGTVSAINSTISGNAAGQGSGIFNDQPPGNLSMVNLTIAANTGSGEAIRNRNVATAVNTIVSNPNSVSNCGGNIGSNGHNISSDGTCGFTGAGDISNVDPLLEPLADNGGPTQTHALLGASPAIDAADNLVCPATDQRGAERPRDGNADGVPVCDIGAFELDVVPVDCLSVCPDPSSTPSPEAAVTLPLTGSDVNRPAAIPWAAVAVAFATLAVVAIVFAARRMFTHR
jgi:hypothetical protein